MPMGDEPQLKLTGEWLNFLWMVEVPLLLASYAYARGTSRQATTDGGKISIDRRCRRCYSPFVFSSFHQAKNPWS